MTNSDIQAEAIVHKIKHYLITMMGVTIEQATDEEIFRAFSLTLREEIMTNWTATIRTMKKENPRTLYYICMEYLPGRFLNKNLANIHAGELVKIVMKKLGRDFHKILMMERDPALGNGGLGRLASCFLDSLATQQYPAVGYGLRYQYGIFQQEVWNGRQVERPEGWLLYEYPWEFRRDVHAMEVMYGGEAVPTKNDKGVETYDLIDFEEVRALSYDLPIIGYRETHDFSVLSLRLWTTKESPRNFKLQRYNAGLLDQAAENTTLTDVLYPNDNNEMGKRVRLKQEYLLAAASVGDIVGHYYKNVGDMSLFADKVRIHLNDTHPALAIAELMHILLHTFHFGWGEAFEVVRTCVNYTNHTVLKEALEQWNAKRVSELLPRQYRIIQRLNEDFCREIRTKFPNDEARVKRMSIIEDGQVKMANLSIYGSHRVNGVAALHSEILKKDIFKDFYELYPDKFINVTNGVTQRRWINNCNPRLAEFFFKRIGKGWITDLTEIEQLSKFASDKDCQEEFLEIKRANKRSFSDFLKAHNPIRDAFGKVVGTTDPLGKEALFDVQIKRIHEYKRQLMNVLHGIMLYHELLENPNARAIQRMIVIGGKAAPGYAIAKNIIRLICCLSRKINNDPHVRKKLRVIYYENYNASRAEKIIPATDLSEQISCAGQEASGTGNMKLAMNGALTIGTEDGASIEMHEEITDQWWPFGFGATAEENAEMTRTNSYNPWDIYKKHPNIQRAIDALKDHSLAESEEEHEAFLSIYRSILEPSGGQRSDRYFVLNDLPSYFETQKKAEKLFQNPHKWAEVAIQNIAHMNKFSADESVHNYSKLVWGLLPCPVDPKELELVRKQYSEHDKCRII
ncbi:MAG: Maltodextrin phosphorylase [Chlamydiae bacterium]|nr:Maltodextrin phosphorylase [Chlamydiota bacterium]